MPSKLYYRAHRQKLSAYNREWTRKKRGTKIMKPTTLEAKLKYALKKTRVFARTGVWVMSPYDMELVEAAKLRDAHDPRMGWRPTLNRGYDKKLSTGNPQIGESVKNLIWYN